MITIVEPHYDWSDLAYLVFGDLTRHIEKCARVCYRSEHHISTDSADKFVPKLCKSGHESVLEHASLTARVVCSRACSHQLVRHRIGAYSQESQRYVKAIKPEIHINTPEDIVELYQKGLSCNKIAKKSEGRYTEWEVYQILKKRNIDRRGHGSRGLIYSNFFEVIDTAEKAYLVGLILSDGNISRNQLTITQHSNNIWYIKKMFQVFLRPETNTAKDNGNCKRVHVTSKKLIDDLESIGIIPNKTQKLTEYLSTLLWQAIPEQFKPDFLRGFLDGDGSVWFSVQKNGKTKRHVIQWLGHWHTLKLIKDWAHDKYGTTKAEVNKVRDTKNLYRFALSDPEKVELCCRDMYKNFMYPFGHPIKAGKIISYFNLNKEVYSSENGMEVILPPSIRHFSLWSWYETMDKIAEAYSDLLLLGVRPEDARFVLPNAAKTELAVTYNLRIWRHVIKERGLNPKAQWEIRKIFGAIYKDLKFKLPAIFGDLE